MINESPHIDFQAPATLRKWPSLSNRRREDREPYLVAEDTLDACVRKFMTKPEASRELYDIITSPQPPLVPPIMDAEQIMKIAR